MEWYTELENKYIHLFEVNSNTGKPLRGIECGKGWKKPVEDFLESLDWHTKHNLKDKQPNEIKIFQIKEKFGRVRAYVDKPEHIDSIIECTIGRLEGKCELTCENCGRIGNADGSELTPTEGWIAYVCEECKTKHQ